MRLRARLQRIITKLLLPEECQSAAGFAPELLHSYLLRGCGQIHCRSVCNAAHGDAVYRWKLSTSHDKSPPLMAALQGLGSGPSAHIHHPALQAHLSSSSSTAAHMAACSPPQRRAAMVQQPSTALFSCVGAKHPTGWTRPCQAQPSTLSGVMHLHSSSHSMAQELTSSNPEAISRLEDQVASCQTLTQLKPILEQHSHEFTTKALLSAVTLLASHRQQDTTSDFKAMASTLGATFNRLLRSMPPGDVVLALQGFGRLRINPAADEPGLKELCAHLKTEVMPALLSESEVTGLVNMLWAVSEISCHGELQIDEELFVASVGALQLHMSKLPLRSIAKVASAFAKAGNQEYNLMLDICDEAENRLKDARGFDAAAFTNITRHLVASNMPLSNGYLHRLAEHVIARTPGLKVHHVITLATCFAQEKYGDADSEWDGSDSPHVVSFWENVSGYVLRHRQQLTAQNVQDVMYAYALRGIQDSTLFHVLTTRARELIASGACKPVNVSILLWACGRHALRHEVMDDHTKADLATAAARYIKDHYTSFSIQNLSNSLWALATLAHKDQELLDNVCAHLRKLLEDPDGRPSLQVDASSGVERFCVPNKADLVERWQEADGQVMERVHYKSGNVVVRPLGSALPQRHFICQNLTDIAWSLSVLEQPDQELYALLAERLIDNIAGCSLISIVDMCWAMCKQGYSHPALLQAVERHLLDTRLVNEAGLDYLSEVLFAMAKLEHTPSQEFLEEALTVCNQKWDRPTRDDNTRYRTIWSLYALNTLGVHPTHPFNRRIADYVASAQMAEQGQAPASNAGVEGK